MKQKHIFIESLLALVFALLVLVPQIGYLFGFIALILSIDVLAKTKKGRIKKPTSETKKAKLFAIIAIITTFLIIILKILFFVTTVIGPLTQILSDFSQLNYEDALTKCQSQEEKTQEVCYVGLALFHANDTRVTSGKTCQQIESEEVKTACFSFVAGMTINPEICQKISDQSPKYSDARNHCLALTTGEAIHCNQIFDPKTKMKCTSDLAQQKIKKALQPS